MLQLSYARSSSLYAGLFFPANLYSARPAINYVSDLLNSLFPQNGNLYHCQPLFYLPGVAFAFVTTGGT